jgi:hypothetical protein
MIYKFQGLEQCMRILIATIFMALIAGCAIAPVPTAE